MTIAGRRTACLDRIEPLGEPERQYNRSTGCRPFGSALVGECLGRSEVSGRVGFTQIRAHCVTEGDTVRPKDVDTQASQKDGRAGTCPRTGNRGGDPVTLRPVVG